MEINTIGDSPDPFRKMLLDKYNNIKVCRGVWTGQCTVCKQPVSSETVISVVDAPFMAVIHDKCLPYFSFDSGWVHPYPLSFYSQNTNRV